MRIIILLILLPLASLAQQPKNFTLKGSAPAAKGLDWVYLTYRNGEDVVRDSVKSDKGQFLFKGTLAEPIAASLRLSYGKGSDGRPKMEGAQLYLDGGNISVSIPDTITNMVVKGSPAHADFEKLTAAQKPYRTAINDLYAEWVKLGKENNKEGQEKIIQKRETLNAEMLEKANKAFIDNHPASPVALYALTQYAGYDIDADKAEPLFNKIAAAVRATPSGVAFSEQLEIAKKVGIGKIAMDFTQEDTSGMPVSLSSLRGKYVLVDFWASWCGPCRAENPNVVAVFNKYKDRGFTVMGVSLDREGAKDKWMKAIHDDNLTWTHVSDLKFWNNAVAQQYGIKAIPMNLLIDPEGKIIAKNIRGEELGQVVEKAVTKTL